MRRLATFAALALAGCAAVRGADAPVTMRLQPTFPAPAAAREGTIAIAPVLARGMTADRRYTYVAASASGVLRQAASFFWEEPPPRLLERALADALGTRYAQVYTSAVTLPAERRVIATLTRFEEEAAGASASATVAFDAAVTHDGAIERSGHYCARASIAGPSGTERARAFESALAGAVQAFVAGATSSGC